jgi:exodeoxyribonuclease V gamma subunit
VLAPDIDQYAPFVQAVFGGEAQARHAIPFALADGSTLATQPLADAFLQLLDLPASRFAVNEVLDLLRHARDRRAVRTRRCRLRRAAALARRGRRAWGLNAEQRAQGGAPAEPGLHLGLGARPPAARACQRQRRGHGGIAPLPPARRRPARHAGSLLQGLRRLAHWQRAWRRRAAEGMGRRAGPRNWCKAFFPSTRATTATARRSTTCARAPRNSPPKRSPRRWTNPSTLRWCARWFAPGLVRRRRRTPTLPHRRHPFGPQWFPMRLVPFKVICLLGMDDGAFPRRDPAGSLNRLAAAPGHAAPARR